MDWVQSETYNPSGYYTTPPHVITTTHVNQKVHLGKALDTGQLRPSNGAPPYWS